jgi:hypothetical protein
MSRIQVGVVRYPKVGAAIARALGGSSEPECRIGHGRVTLTFRRLGATHWPEAQQLEYALRAASVARSILASDARSAVRRRAGRAIDIVYEDATLVQGYPVAARWECVVPAAQPVTSSER